MVMFKARFKPLADRPLARAQAQQQQQPQAKPRMQQQQQPQPVPQPQVPPIEEERGPQYPVREPEPKSEPERALCV
jgi:hypothetical protein